MAVRRPNRATKPHKEEEMKIQEEEHQAHIIMVPFMAQGHINPFVSLAKKLSKRNPSLTITLVNTPLNIQSLCSSPHLLSSSSSKINLIELPFSSSDHGLPPNSESTDTLPSHLISKLFFASETLKPSFQNLITNISQKDKHIPLCIISDIFMGWTLDVAKSVNASHYTFTTGGGYGTIAYFSIWLNLPHLLNLTNDEFHAPGFPDSCVFHVSQIPTYLRDIDGNDPLCKMFQKHISFSLRSDGMLCNTVEEIEIFGMKALRDFTNQQPIWAVGPLLPPILLGLDDDSSSSDVSRSGKKHGVSPEICINWLNFQQPSSVLYISFGSQNTIKASQMMELAKGIEASGIPFIWVLRNPREFDTNGEFRTEEWLPEGFEERINGRKIGLLIRKWAPQLEILSHKSTGGFLSHCGWNSILESLSQGIPIIGWSLAAEQGYNAKMMVEEMGVCVELTRGFEKEIESKDVKRVVHEVMSKDKEGKGEEMRKKAMVIAEKMRVAVREDGDQKGSSVEAIDDFIRNVLSL